MIFSTDGTATTDFEVTPVTMPTYLLAFVVSDLGYSDPFPSVINKYRQRIYSVANQARVSQSIWYSIQYLELLESFVGTSYKLPKLYSVAVPDHGSAMENYVGKILFKTKSFEFRIFN